MTTPLDLAAHPIAPLLRRIVACYDRAEPALPSPHWLNSIDGWVATMREEQREGGALALVDFERIARWALAGATACEREETARKASARADREADPCPGSRGF